MNKLLGTLMVGGVVGLQSLAGAAPVASPFEIGLGPYAVFDLQIKGKGFDPQEDKGSFTYSYRGLTEKDTFDAVGIGKRMAKGIVVLSEDSGYGYFIMTEKGDYSVMGVGFGDEMVMGITKGSMKETDTTYSSTSSGVLGAEFELYGEDVYVGFTLMGKWNMSISEKYTAPEALLYDVVSAKTNFSFTATGAGTGYEYFDGEDWEDAEISVEDDLLVYADKVKMKFNKKMTETLTEAYSSSTNGQAAVEAALNEYINKKAKIDDADFEFEFSPEDV